MEFSPSSMRVEMQTTEFYWDGVTSPATVLRLVSSVNFYGSAAYIRRIAVDGVDTDVIFVHMTETLSTRWKQNHDIRTRYVHLAGISEGRWLGSVADTDEAKLPHNIEVYYVNFSFRNMLPMSDDEFYALRHEGVLMWSGMFE